MSQTNFHPGYLNQGDPLGMTMYQGTLTADDQLVDPTGFLLVQLSPDSVTAANRTFTLVAGGFIGQQVTLENIAGSSYTCQLADSGNCKLVAVWEPLQYDTLTLFWDGFYWIEQARTIQSGVPYPTPLPSGDVIIGNATDVATNVSANATGSASKIRAKVGTFTFTVTLASPGIFTAVAHGMIVGDALVFSTTGALPTGLTAGTIYYVTVVATADTFQVSATVSGTSVNTSGSQSGVHTATYSGLAYRALSIGNADIAALAGVSYSKLATLASGNILVGSAGGVATSVAMSGLVAIANTGATSIPLVSAHILVGSGGGVAADVALTGDISVTNAGVSAIGAGKVLDAMLDPQTTAGLKAQRTAHGIFDATAGKATAAFNLGATLPANAFVTGAWYWVKTTFTSATDAGTIALSIEAANDEVSAIAISNGGNPWDTTALPVEGITKIETTSTWLKTTQARALTATVAVEALTAGVLHFWVDYFVVE